MSNNLEDRLQKKISQWLERDQTSKVIGVEGSGIALGSSIGLVRKENQDRVLFLRVKLDRPPRQFFVVAALCDGMGGMAKGGRCANLALSVFATSLIRSQEVDYPKKLETAIQEANKAVFREFNGDGGTTLSAVACNEENQCWAINVGDSRIYQVLANGKVEKLSVDDTIEGQLEALNRLKNTHSSEESKKLVQYVGMGKSLEPHHIQVGAIATTKLLLLTSDGAHSMPADTFQQIIIHAKSSTDIVDHLITHSEWVGGKDNATVVAMSTDGGFGVSEADVFISGTVEIWGVSGKVEIWTPSVLQPKETIAQEQLAIDQVSAVQKQQKPRPPRKNRKKESKDADRNDVRNVLEDQKPIDDQLSSSPQLTINLSDES